MADINNKTVSVSVDRKVGSLTKEKPSSAVCTSEKENILEAIQNITSNMINQKEINKVIESMRKMGDYLEILLKANEQIMFRIEALETEINQISSSFQG